MSGMAEIIKFYATHLGMTRGSAEMYANFLRPELKLGALSKHDYITCASLLAWHADEPRFKVRRRVPVFCSSHADVKTLALLCR